MRFWRSESDQQTPQQSASAVAQQAGGRAYQGASQSRGGEKKEVGRGRRVVVCRGRRGRQWRYLPGPGVVVVVAGRRSSASVGCCRCRRKEELPRASMFSLASFAVAPWRRMALTSPQCGALATVHMRLGRPSQPKALTPNSVAVRIHHRFHQHGTKGFFFYSSSPVKHRSYKPSRSSYSEKRSHDTKPPALELFSLSTRMKGFEAERCIKTYSCSHHSPPSHRLLPARCTTCRL